MAGRRRSRDFPSFPAHVAEGSAPDTDIHAILDDVPSRNRTISTGGRAGSPPALRFTPTAASWTDAMESVRGLTPGGHATAADNAVFDPPDECVAAIGSYIDNHDGNGLRLFRWSRNPEQLVASWKCGYHRIDSSH